MRALAGSGFRRGVSLGSPRRPGSFCLSTGVQLARVGRCPARVFLDAADGRLLSCPGAAYRRGGPVSMTCPAMLPVGRAVGVSPPSGQGGLGLGVA